MLRWTVNACGAFESAHRNEARRVLDAISLQWRPARGRRANMSFALTR
jgi:hypothetical protein